jgi:amino acid transporter
MAYTALARMQQETGQKDSALRNAKLGLQHAQLTSYLKGIFNASLLISQLLEDRGQLDSAFVYQKMAYNAKDSLFGVEKTRQVAAMNYSEQQREQEIISRKNQDLEERKMNLQYAAIGIALVLGLLVFLLLSRQVITSTRTIEIVGVVALLFIFEFINLLIHPFIGNLTHHSPLWMLLIMVGIAALLVPLHHKVEKRMTHQLVEKNKRIRLAAAKKTIAQLDKQEHAPGDGEAVKHGGK